MPLSLRPGTVHRLRKTAEGIPEYQGPELEAVGFPGGFDYWNGGKGWGSRIVELELGWLRDGSRAREILEKIFEDVAEDIKRRYLEETMAGNEVEEKAKGKRKEKRKGKEKEKEDGAGDWPTMEWCLLVMKQLEDTKEWTWAKGMEDLGQNVVRWALGGFEEDKKVMGMGRKVREPK
ncbi:hypothetical protein BDZ91DRAFT_22207 [Kalaharituber pfeilii]|nr:hypothetical protein BDZ91DRAFT_22207 [Kalaharituber pfeilii]